MSKVDWRAGRSPGREHGYLGSQLVAVLEPHEGPFAGSFRLDVLLPGCGGEKLVQHDETGKAKEYFDKVILPRWLKQTGLQFIPPKKPTANAVDTFTDAEGTVLNVGDTVQAKLTSFDGPSHLFGVQLTIVKLGRTKVSVGNKNLYGDQLWSVSSQTLVRIQLTEGGR
ncbi:hypothetical protein [Nonomuraea typhae]|uniref:S1 motif domain-containing protein n=1 Tax=Nonomuraea typhae TaxID=2603600 RepID=A0ABW7YJC7_9ACTN